MKSVPADLRKALKILKKLGLDDYVYDIREREGKGWDGPKVQQFSEACKIINKYLRGDK